MSRIGQEPGLYYYRARYYDPAAGRFLSEDPIRLLSGNNFYRYVKNRPIDFRDPSKTMPSNESVYLKCTKERSILVIVDAAGAIPVEGNLLSAVQLTVGIVGGIPQYAKDPVVATRNIRRGPVLSLWACPRSMERLFKDGSSDWKHNQCGICHRNHPWGRRFPILYEGE